MQGGRDEEETEITLNVDFFSLIFSPVLYNSLFFFTVIYYIYVQSSVLLEELLGLISLICLSKN